MAIQTVAQDFLVPAVGESLPSAPTAGAVRLYGGQIANRPTIFYRNADGKALPLQNSFARSRIAWATANGNTTTVSVFGLTITNTGTATAAATGSGSFYASQRRVDILVTSASTTAVAGFRYNESQMWRGDTAGFGGFLFNCRWGPSTGVATSTTRGFCGLMSATGAPSDANPSSNNNVLGMGWDNGDTNISFMHKTGSGTVVKETLSGSWPRPSVNNTDVFDISIYSAPNGSTIEYEITNLTTGVTTRGSVSSDLPANTTFLCPKCYMSVGGTSSVIGVSLFNMFIESDL